MLMAVLAVLAAGTALIAFWEAGCLLPPWTAWEEFDEPADLDGDGTDELLSVQGRAYRIVDDGHVACASLGEWLVSDAAAGDIDGDGCMEVISLVWKRGSFGEHRPFWIERDEKSLSQHVFIHRYCDGELVPVWMSSALGLQVADLALDGAGRVRLTDPDGELTMWAWTSWGLTLVEDADADAGMRAGEPGTLTMVAVGDNIAHAGVYERAWEPERGRYDFSPVYRQVAGRISAFDVAAVNQETILVADPALRGEFPLFGTPQDMGDALVDAGFDVVCGATNHAADRGSAGLADTIAFWRERHPEVQLLGLHETAGEGLSPGYVEANGIRLALFDATYGLNGRALEPGCGYAIDTLDDVDALAANVARARAGADAAVCFLHMGEEYAAGPGPWEREVASRLVAAGADAIVCTHPHVAQPAEELQAGGRSAAVYWSLGNFMSNQMDPATVLGAAAVLRFERDDGGRVNLVSHGALPTVCHFDGEGTRVYFLDDYTDSLARAHYLNEGERSFTLQTLRERWSELAPATMPAPSVPPSP